MIEPTKENIDKYLGEGIYGRLPVISAWLPYIPRRDIFIGPIVWPICKITGYKYSDYMDDREYLIALDPKGFHIYCEDVQPNKQFIKFTDINKLYVKRGVFNPLLLTIKTIDKRIYRITETGYISEYGKYIEQKETANLFYKSLKPLEQSINSGKYRELHQ